MRSHVVSDVKFLESPFPRAPHCDQTTKILSPTSLNNLNGFVKVIMCFIPITHKGVLIDKVQVFLR